MTRIILLGDSTTAGTPGFLSPVEAPPDGRGDVRSQYAYWLSALNQDWVVLNRGVNRERTDQISLRFDRDVLSERPDLVVIIGGVNDIYDGHGAGHAIANLDAMYARALDAGIIVIAGTILPFDTASPAQNDGMRDVNGWIARSAARLQGRRFSVVDTRAAVARAGDPDRLASTPDGLHPDVDGYRRMAGAIAPAIAALLPSVPYPGKHLT